ncbi:hypothetical protein GQ53DRAFT_831335 [Thozetella sp. PMI_491]|nr:hypothetical protein GQ53DRAFT_831335 [Thozetella sp. PMI_491]
MSSYMHGGVFVGLLITCLIFASIEIYSDMTLGPHGLEVAPADRRDAKFVSRPVPSVNPNAGCLVFYSEVHPKTNQRRDRVGFYMKQAGAHESFFGAADNDQRRGVTKALDDLFSTSAQSMRKRIDASSPLVVGPL